MTGTRRATFVFDSTTGALWAEEVAAGAGIPVEVVPAPADSDAKCDLALETLATLASDLAEAMTEAGVPFRSWPLARRP